MSVTRAPGLDVGPSAPPLAVTPEDQPVAIPLSLPVAAIPSCLAQPGVVYSIIAGPAHGVLTGNLAGDLSHPPSLLYTPAAHYHGQDSFTWRVGTSPTCGMEFTQVIQITAVNDPPVPQNLSIQAPANLTTPILLRAVDVDGDPLTFHILVGPSHGTLSGTPPNLIYSPFPNFVGADVIKYSVADSALTPDPLTAVIDIAVKPAVLLENATVTEGNSGTSSARFTVSVNVPVTERVVLNFRTADGTATAGTDYIATSGVLAFTPGGARRQVISVPVNGDRLAEPVEQFFVMLSTSSINVLMLNETGVGVILNDDPTLGTVALTPTEMSVGVGQPVNLYLTWRHPESWRLLNSIDLVIRDHEGTSLAVRWHEAQNSFSLFDPACGCFVRTAPAGSPVRFEGAGAFLHLQASSGGGFPGPTVTVCYNVSFKPEAAGRTYRVEAFATDDYGNQQGFEPVGDIKVLAQ